MIQWHLICFMMYSWMPKMTDNNTENMTNNPYANNLIEMGYDKQDVMVASTMFQKKTFPCVIHGRQFDTEEQYYSELHDYMNGM